MSGLLNSILNAPAWTVYGLVGLLVFAEDALFVGFVLPGETAALLGGVAANRGHVSVVTVLIIVMVAAIVGDTVGYEVGRHVGSRVLNLGVFDKRRARLDEARDFLARRGGFAVFLGRWIAFFRAVMPLLAGTARMPYPRFLVFNAAGGIAWGTVIVLVGYYAGASYDRVATSIGGGAAVVALVLVLAGLAFWRVRRHRAERRVEQSRDRNLLV